MPTDSPIRKKTTVLRRRFLLFYFDVIRTFSVVGQSDWRLLNHNGGLLIVIESDFHEASHERIIITLRPYKVMKEEIKARTISSKYQTIKQRK